MNKPVTLLNIGFGNVVLADRVVAIVNPASAPMKRLREEARVAGKLVDATQGRRTRAIVITDSDHVILSAIQAETVAHRLQHGGLSPDAEERAARAAGATADPLHELPPGGGDPERRPDGGTQRPPSSARGRGAGRQRPARKAQP